VRVAVFEGPGRVVTTTRPEPELSAGDVLVEVLAAGVCGTDVRIYKGEHRAARPGRVPGHEVIGRVIRAAGPLPPAIAVDDAVFVAPNIGCGWCRWCGRGQENLCPNGEAIGITLDGGFAERLVVPARAVRRGNLVSLGTASAGAVLAEPLACVLRGQAKLNLAAGESVLVCGGGPVGLLHVALAKARGAGLVICSEPTAGRRQAALKAGAHQVCEPAVLPDLVDGLTGGAGVDIVITAAPVPGLQAQALELAATGGRVLLFGGLAKSNSTVALDTNLIHYKELTVVATTASALEDCRAAVGLIEAGLIDVSWMVSDRYDLDQFDQAIARAADSAGLKVVVIPGGEGK
jgi:L-iditol 2-dehydrogenase